MAKRPHLTKSKYLSGLRCVRKLWFDVHDHGPYVDAEPGSAMDIGNRVGRGAHTLFPGGVEIEAPPWEHDLAVEQTRRLMEDGETPAIFEAAFEYDGIRVRVDVLERLAADAWGLREVKSSLSVKHGSGHYDDVAVQLYVLRGCDINVPSAELVHVNRDYVRGEGKIDWPSLLTHADLTEEAEELLQEIEGILASQKIILDQDTAPDVYPSKGLCKKPYVCDYWDRCTADKPEDWIIQLPYIRQNQIDQLVNAGIEAIRDIPEDFPLSDTHQLVREVLQTGTPYVSEELGVDLNNLGPPAYYLDFETMSPIIPLYPGTSPIERIPFQWSVHHLDGNGALSHYEFLADGDVDPRRELTEKLLDVLHDSDTPILAYFASFERGVIQELADLFPDLAPTLEELIARIGDPHPIVRSHAYYPDFKGSFSLKTVAPALAPELDYGDLDGVADGLAASAAFWGMASGTVARASETQRTRQELLDYCKLDTEALMKVHLKLRNLANI